MLSLVEKIPPKALRVWIRYLHQTGGYNKVTLPHRNENSTAEHTHTIQSTSSTHPQHTLSTSSTPLSTSSTPLSTSSAHPQHPSAHPQHVLNTPSAHPYRPLSTPALTGWTRAPSPPRRWCACSDGFARGQVDLEHRAQERLKHKQRPKRKKRASGTGVQSE